MKQGTVPKDSLLPLSCIALQPGIHTHWTRGSQRDKSQSSYVDNESKKPNNHIATPNLKSQSPYQNRGQEVEDWTLHVKGKADKGEKERKEKKRD